MKLTHIFIIISILAIGFTTGYLLIPIEKIKPKHIYSVDDFKKEDFVIRKEFPYFVNDQITIGFAKNIKLMDKYQFRLQEKIGDTEPWTILSAYNDNIPEYIPKRVGKTSIHIDCIVAKNPSRRKGIWIGTIDVKERLDKPLSDCVAKQNKKNKCIQALLLLALYVFGVLFLLTWKNKIDIYAICIFAFPIGVSIWLLLSILILLTGLPFSLPVISTVIIMFLIPVIYIICKKISFNKKDIIALIISSTVFSGIAALASVHNFAFISSDSRHFIRIGSSIAHYGQVFSAIESTLSNYGIGVTLYHTLGALFGLEYFYALQPTLSACFAAGFAYIIYRALRIYNMPEIYSIGLGILAAGALASTYFILFNAYYIASNMTAGIYFTLTMGSLWLYIKDKNPAWLVITALSLISFGLSRIESPVFAIIFLVILIAQERIESKHAFIIMLPFTFITITWDIFIYLHQTGGLNADEIILKPFIILVTSSVLIGMLIFQYLTKFRWIMIIKKALPLLMLYLMAIVIVAMLFKDNKLAPTNFWAILENMFHTGMWDSVWAILFILSITCLSQKAFETESFFVYNIIGFALLYFISFLFREGVPLRAGFGDSANRMLLHIVPVILLYLTIKFGYNMNKIEEEKTEAAPSGEITDEVRQASPNQISS